MNRWPPVVGKSRSAVTNSVRLLGLPGAIQTLLVDGKISAGAARALLGTDDTAYAVRIANKAAAEGWSVRQVEEAVRARPGRPPWRRSGPEPKDRAAQIIALEERTRRAPGLTGAHRIHPAWRAA